MQINNKFNIGQFVYAKTDPQQYKRIVLAVVVEFNNAICYTVGFNETERTFREIELSSEQDTLMKNGVDGNADA